MGLNPAVIEQIGKNMGLESLNVIKGLLQSGVPVSEINILLNSGLNITDDILELAQRGILPSQYEAYGIINRIEEEWVVQLCRDGFNPDTIVSLVSNRIPPSGVYSSGIRSEADAIGFINRIDNVPAELSSKVGSALRAADMPTKLEGIVGGTAGNKLVKFQEPIGPGGTIGEIDVETDKIIIEVFSGKTGKEPNQLVKYFDYRAQYMNPQGKQVFLYAPNIVEWKVPGFESMGVKVIRNINDLIQIL